MKIILYLSLLLINLLIINYAYSCPNCVGKVTESSPPFFLDEFYVIENSSDENNDISQEAAESE